MPSGYVNVETSRIQVNKVAKKRVLSHNRLDQTVNIIYRQQRSVCFESTAMLTWYMYYYTDLWIYIIQFLKQNLS